MIARVHATIASILSFFLAAVTSHAGDVSIRLDARPDREIFKQGDRLSITVIFDNTSVQTVRILPKTVVYPAAAFQAKKATNGQRGRLLTYADVDIDAEQWMKEVIILKPRTKYSYTIPVEVAKRLPKEYRDRSDGLYLVFPLSAIQLPGFGEYSITMKYDSVDHPIGRLVTGSPKLLQEAVSTTPLVLSFAKR